MRTTEQIMKEISCNSMSEDIDTLIRRKFHVFSDHQWEQIKNEFPYSEIKAIVQSALWTDERVKQAINEARIEIIKECAERAKIIEVGNMRKKMPTGSCFRSVEVYVPIYQISKQSILNLINEVK